MTHGVRPDATLREGRVAYYQANGLAADGGYNDKWVRVDIGPIPFVFPNTEGRKRLVPYHDLHHVVTGYATDLLGEAQIGAWEIATGMTEKTGLRLDLRVFGFVLPRHPRELFAAFVRGRNSRNLLDRTLDDGLLDRSVADVRCELGLDRSAPPATPDDRRAFALWSAKAIAIVWGPILPLAAIAWYLLR